MIPKSLHERLMIKSKSSKDFRKTAIKEFKKQQYIQKVTVPQETENEANVE